MHGVVVGCLLFNGLFRRLLIIGFRLAEVVAGCAFLYRFVIAIRLQTDFQKCIERYSLIY